jgi:ubiquinone/menaquinone biosynthesis C-methylase UbiE
MDNTHVFTSKADTYDRFRWGYAPDSIATILKTTQVSTHSTIVDLGAGTGILTRHLIGKVGQVYMVEPNPAMRRVAAQVMAECDALQILEERAEATGLPDRCADLVTVAQAIHWFDPQPARAEIWRLLKPSGWLAVLRNYGADETLNTAIEDVYTEENGCDPAIIINRPAWKPMEFFFGDGHFLRRVFPFVEKMTRDRFIGALSTASYAPDEDDPLYPRFARTAGKVFEMFSQDGILANPVKTELYLGKVSG